MIDMILLTFIVSDYNMFHKYPWFTKLMMCLHKFTDDGMIYLQEDLNAIQVEVRHFDIALAEVAPSNPGPNPEFFTKHNRGLFSGNSRRA